MIEPSCRVASACAAAHHEELDRGVLIRAIIDVLEPAVEPAPAEFQKIGCDIRVERSCGTEIDIAREGRRPLSKKNGRNL